jgi:hypothetical protein
MPPSISWRTATLNALGVSKSPIKYSAYQSCTRDILQPDLTGLRLTIRNQVLELSRLWRILSKRWVALTVRIAAIYTCVRDSMLTISSGGKFILLCSKQRSSDHLRFPLSGFFFYSRSTICVGTHTLSPKHHLIHEAANTIPGQSHLCSLFAPLHLQLDISSVRWEHLATAMSTFTLHL